MRDDLFLFIGLLILIFVVWVASGGPSRPLSFAGPYLNPISQTGTKAGAYGDPNQYSSVNSTATIGLGGVSIAGNGSSGGVSSGKTVSLSRDIAGAGASDPDEEYVIINVSGAAKAPVSTAGWRLVSSATGRSAIFPAGTETPHAGAVNPSSTIVLSPGDEAVVATGRSPVGVSFRENLCTGYFEEHQDFHPSLSLSCPTPSQELAKYYPDAPDACVAYVRSIPYCGTDTSASSADVPSSCTRFADDRLNYNGCVAAHETEAGFLGRTWRIFLGQGDDLYRSGHDTITLLDGQGKVIDSLTY